MGAAVTLVDLPLFDGLSEAALRVLAASAVQRHFAAGEVLWVAGSKARGVLIVLDGEVRVVTSRNGRQHVLHTEGAGGTLGDVAFFQAGVYPATAVAQRATTCLMLGRDALHAAIAADPVFAFRLLGRLAARVRELIARLDRVSSQSVPARLTAYLLARHERSGSDWFTLGGTQQQVAEEIGTVREVVVRTLRSLREQGIIESRRSRYHIVDMARLREIGSPSLQA